MLNDNRCGRKVDENDAAHFPNAAVTGIHPKLKL